MAVLFSSLQKLKDARKSFKSCFNEFCVGSSTRSSLVLQLSERTRRRLYANYVADQEQQSRVVENITNVIEDQEVWYSDGDFFSSCG